MQLLQYIGGVTPVSHMKDYDMYGVSYQGHGQVITSHRHMFSYDKTTYFIVIQREPKGCF